MWATWITCKTITCRTDATKIIVNQLKADESYSVSQIVHINQTIIIDKNFFPPTKICYVMQIVSVSFQVCVKAFTSASMYIQ